MDHPLEGRSFASRYGCKFMETSCTIGFNLDNLLVGLRTQLVLRHHLALNSVFQNGKWQLDTKIDLGRDYIKILTIDGKYNTYLCELLLIH